MKRALVTGGSGAIGAAIARALAAAGHHVIVHANANPQRAEALAVELRVIGSAEAVAFDVADDGACASSIEALLEGGPIQLLINNAGIHDDAVMAGMSAEQWRRVIDVSLNGFYNVTQPLLLPMIGTRWGRIVTITSIAGITGNRGQANYAAAKAGLHGATKALALEVASRGITVNAVAPGIIATPMSAETFPKETIDRLVPMKRAGTPEDVAGLVAYLCTDAAAYVTGQVISVNGGMI